MSNANLETISKQLTEIHHDLITIQARLMEVTAQGLEGDEETAALVSIAKTYQDAIDMLKKNGSLCLEDLKAKGLKSLAHKAGTAMLHGIESSASVRVKVTETADSLKTSLSFD